VPIGRAWLVTAAIHVLAVVLFFTVNLAAPWRKAEYVVLPPRDIGDSMVFVPGTREARAKGPTIQTTQRVPLPPPAAPQSAVPAPVDTAPTLPAYDPNASRVAPAPQVGDGRLWVSPRPGLPAAVAEQPPAQAVVQEPVATPIPTPLATVAPTPAPTAANWTHYFSAQPR